MDRKCIGGAEVKKGEKAEESAAGEREKERRTETGDGRVGDKGLVVVDDQEEVKRKEGAEEKEEEEGKRTWKRRSTVCIPGPSQARGRGECLGRSAGPFPGCSLDIPLQLP